MIRLVRRAMTRMSLVDMNHRPHPYQACSAGSATCPSPGNVSIHLPVTDRVRPPVRMGSGTDVARARACPRCELVAVGSLEVVPVSQTLVSVLIGTVAVVIPESFLRLSYISMTLLPAKSWLAKFFVQESMLRFCGLLSSLFLRLPHGRCFPPAYMLPC